MDCRQRCTRVSVPESSLWTSCYRHLKDGNKHGTFPAFTHSTRKTGAQGWPEVPTQGKEKNVLDEEIIRIKAKRGQRAVRDSVLQTRLSKFAYNLWRGRHFKHQHAHKCFPDNTHHLAIHSSVDSISFFILNNGKGLITHKLQFEKCCHRVSKTLQPVRYRVVVFISQR